MTLPLEASYPALRTYVQEDLPKQAKDDIRRQKQAWPKHRQLARQRRERLASQPATAPAAISAAAPVATAGPEGAARIDFAKEVKPIFEMNCLSCHKSANAKSGLSLETLESAQEGGRLSGPAVIPQRGSESPLILYLQGKKKPQNAVWQRAIA